jgi:ribosomal protein L11 methyltransferase
MYLWHKFASSHWLGRGEPTLQEFTNGGLVVIQSPDHKLLRLEVCSSSRQMVESLLTRFGGEIERLPRNWRDRFAATAKIKPLRIGTRLTIRSTRKSNRVKTQTARELIISAAGAFGTGEHATTAMCLRLIERVTRQWRTGWSMLDAGTGSGILALAARCFGAVSVIAIDNDPRAIAIAKSNARLNRIRGIRFEIADAKKPNTRGKVDLIAANLYSDLLVAAIPKWKAQLPPTGFLILSGLLRSQERQLIRALHRNEFEADEMRRRGKWTAILARNQKAS